MLCSYNNSHSSSNSNSFRDYKVLGNRYRVNSRQLTSIIRSSFREELEHLKPTIKILTSTRATTINRFNRETKIILNLYKSKIIWTCSISNSSNSSKLLAYLILVMPLTISEATSVYLTQRSRFKINLILNLTIN